MIAAIVALDRNRLIGGGNDLLWHLPDDLQHFKTKTLGQPIIMGRKTYDSVGARPLPKRTNIVITRQANYNGNGAQVVDSLEAAIELARKESEDLWIVGGGEIYRRALPMCDALEITEVDANIQGGDTWFPEYRDEFTEVSREHHPADERHAYAMDFVRYERKV